MLFTRHKEGLFNFALRLTTNRADAEDAVSHSFMMVCEKRYQPKPGASFKTWLYAVARNLCLSKLRTKNRFFSLWTSKENGEEQMVDVADSTSGAREQLSRQEAIALIQKAIAKLPAEQKEALLLREYHGFGYEEIAQVLDCSLEKVKVLIFRARSHLKAVLPPVLMEEGGVQ